MENILRILISDKENHPIKAITHEKILNKFLDSQSVVSMQKWVQLFNKITMPIRYTQTKLAH